ncbi:leucine-rich repeat-containing protein 71 isoform X1 [Channa argus]|uniref:leucine-rich repeat-containing protein 71 isoform X1 n=1 Tax=Channa argus TaxID=215402 RepID=UPI003522ABA0
MSKKRNTKEQKTDKLQSEEEASKTLGQTLNETLPSPTFDEYQCSGNVEIDFPGLCVLLDIKDIPPVSTKNPVSYATENTVQGEDAGTDNHSQSHIAASKTCLKVDLENENPLSATSMKISGWKVDEKIARVLQKMLPSLSQLQILQFWQARLTDQMVISLMSTISLCSNLRVVAIEGNPLPKQSYHLLLSEDSTISHLSLRNNWIGDEGACLIGSALSTTRSSNKNLLFLNLAFNSIGDAGAAHIAQGLRLNRALLFLSLSNNKIGDVGASHLAAILGVFALTHEEVVERRKLLLEKAQSPSLRVDSDRTSVSSSTLQSISKGESKGTSKKKEASKKDEKAAAPKENSKLTKKSSEVKVPQSKGSKPGGKDKQQQAQVDNSSTALSEQLETVDIVNPLLDQLLQYKDGQLFLPGNTTLTSLNLAGNRITEKSVPLFLASLEMQGEERGLLRLCLERNRFPLNCESYVKIKELMALTDHLEKNISEQTEEEGQGA